MTFLLAADGALVLLPRAPACLACGREKTGTSWVCVCGHEPLDYKRAKRRET